ncbi:protease inhibitor I9 family protein [Amycolatopsis sp. NPDC059657]|uniref:protease inhibitor I9 family protein n=1 Tax=Amycolatopsis sp. NPDC059657 TaxID=3346899 RepID=UPI00366A5DEA
MREHLIPVALLLSAVTSLALAAPASAGPEGTIRGAGAEGAVPGSYVVVLKGGEPSRLAAKYGGKLTRTYDTALKGFAVEASEAQARRLAADPAVAYVEQDAVAHITPVSSAAACLRARAPRTATTWPSLTRARPSPAPPP